MTEVIEVDDIEIVLDQYDARENAPLLNDYFSAAAYPKTTQLERDAALIMMRQAWVKALESSSSLGEAVTD